MLFIVIKIIDPICIFNLNNAYVLSMIIVSLNKT